MGRGLGMHSLSSEEINRDNLTLHNVRNFRYHLGGCLLALFGIGVTPTSRSYSKHGVCVTDNVLANKNGFIARNTELFLRTTETSIG